MSQKCALKWCESKFGDGSSLFLLPADPDLREIWKKFVIFEGGKKTRGNLYLCNLHFEEIQIKVHATRRSLSKTAYPSIGCNGKVREQLNLNRMNQKSLFFYFLEIFV